MKTLVASFVLVGGVAVGMLLLTWYFLSVPMRQTRLAATPPASMLSAFVPSEMAELPTLIAHSVPTPSPVPASILATSFPARGFSKALPTPSASVTRTSATVLPTNTLTPPATATASPPSREGCDPAYPDEETCIPPGPPFDQGCAITDERRFTVLPPDPQRLDHDHDGIGCEPIN